MAVTKVNRQVEWSGASSVSVSASSNATSDAHTFDSTSVSAMITTKCDNGSTPSTGDTVDFYILYTTGDPDGAATDEYDTVGHAMHVTTLDTNSEDPARKTVEIPVSAKGFKVYAVNNSSSNAITISAEVYETKAS